jgi:hypothetical protein
MRFDVRTLTRAFSAIYRWPRLAALRAMTSRARAPSGTRSHGRILRTSVGGELAFPPRLTANAIVSSKDLLSPAYQGATKAF